MKVCKRGAYELGCKFIRRGSNYEAANAMRRPLLADRELAKGNMNVNKYSES